MDYIRTDPEPGAMIESLRSVGYSLQTAIADILDNSISAGCRHVWLDFHWEGGDSYLALTDDGKGMSGDELREAMRPGGKGPLEKRSPKDLGRFGLGLKTASFSQARQLSVVSKVAGSGKSVRTWDLDYVEKHNEWRLLTSPCKVAEVAISRLDQLKSGTCVVWARMDRIVGSATTGDPVAHRHFTDAIDRVERHLALTFHRFFEKGSLAILINGRKIAPWNPFMEGCQGGYKSPEERITCHGSWMTLTGYVLPHKDKMTAGDFDHYAGPKGWNGQQGFYLYRNGRLLLCGDWLGLGRPTAWTMREEYRLVRISLDIDNTADNLWHIDIKKAAAFPPAIVRPRLTDLAETLRERARSVYAHRGRYGTNRAPQQELVRPWVSSRKGDRWKYKVNTEHPLVKGALDAAGKAKPDVERLIRLLEETVPVEKIWLDAADPSADHGKPYADIDQGVLLSDMRKTLALLQAAGLNHATAVERIRTLEPFVDYPKLIAELK